MSKLNNDSQKQVTVEDLLRVKRSERPDDAFWGQFDRELHQRMLQTLVKKDPLHLQVWRMLSGRLTQSIGVACAAGVLALMVVRPAFVSTNVADVAVAQAESRVIQVAQAPVEVAMSDLDISAIEGTRDYAIEGISADVVSADASFTRDFGIESFELALDADYSSDVASSRPAFMNTGVATTLVY